MSVFDQCRTGKHDECAREFQRFVIVPNRKRGEAPNRLEYLDEWVRCECLVRSCPCYVKPADREKKKRPKRKK